MNQDEQMKKSGDEIIDEAIKSYFNYLENNLEQAFRWDLERSINIIKNGYDFYCKNYEG